MAKISQNDELNHSASRTIAATIGTLPAALAIAVALTLSLPLPASLRLTVGWYSVFPVWVTAACLTFLTSSGRRAWLSLFAVIALSALIALLALGLGRGAPASWVV